MSDIVEVVGRIGGRVRALLREKPSLLRKRFPTRYPAPGEIAYRDLQYGDKCRRVMLYVSLIFTPSKGWRGMGDEGVARRAAGELRALEDGVYRSLLQRALDLGVSEADLGGACFILEAEMWACDEMVGNPSWNNEGWVKEYVAASADTPRGFLMHGPNDRMGG